MTEKKGFKEKVVEVLTAMYGSVENALQSVMSKRAYVIAMLVYLALSEIDWKKLGILGAVGVVYIWSEVRRKELEHRKEVEKGFNKGKVVIKSLSDSGSSVGDD